MCYFNYEWLQLNGLPVGISYVCIDAVDVPEVGLHLMRRQCWIRTQHIFLIVDNNGVRCNYSVSKRGTTGKKVE